MPEPRPPQDMPGLPEDAAVAAVDGSVGRAGAAAGLAFIHGGTVLLRGAPLPATASAWAAEADGVRLALGAAREAGVARLRVLIDRHDVGLLVQGHRRDEPFEREAALITDLDAAAAAGIAVSARIVQGHAETPDLPSRLNDLAHILGGLAGGDGYEARVPLVPGWLDHLEDADPRFRPTRTPQRWESVLERRRAAHFLGVEPETVDALVRAGHLDVVEGGVSRRSVAAAYVVAQRLRHDAYFGFAEPEGVPGRWEDEILRGWDGRPSQWYHRKSGLRPPRDPADAGEPVEGVAGSPAD